MLLSPLGLFHEFFCFIFVFSVLNIRLMTQLEQPRPTMQTCFSTCSLCLFLQASILSYDISHDLNYNEPDLNAAALSAAPQWSSITVRARQEEVPPSHWILSNVACTCMKLLDSVEMCKKASDVVSKTMEQVSANLEPSPQSWSI
jgi:hypothetical protein